MKRRADVIFRTTCLENEPNFHQCKWLPIEEASDPQNYKTDCYVSGHWVKNYEKVSSQSDYWNWKEEPTAVRKVIYLQDESKKGQKTIFRVM